MAVESGCRLEKSDRWSGKERIEHCCCIWPRWTPRTPRLQRSPSFVFEQRPVVVPVRHIVGMYLFIWVGGDIEQRDKEGMTPLIHACKADQLACVVFLLDSGAQIRARDSDQKTPLHVAAGHASPRVLQSLLERGAEMECVDRKGWRPLDHAVAVSKEDNLRIFLQRGARLGTATWEAATSHPHIM